MLSRKIVTTSWDDGHPLDLRLADLLEKYNLPGTFYIPRANQENDVMQERQIRSLSKRFDLGGHTLNHIRLHGSNTEINKEITGCYHWLADIMGQAPKSFCFPGGVYNQYAIDCATDVGFKILRTTNLLSLSGTSTENLLPTTIQVFDHTPLTYVGHLAKRFRFHDMLILLKNYSGKGLFKMTQNYISYLNAHKGIIHVWGHSWEIEKYDLWRKAETLFQAISNMNDFEYFSNSDLVNTGAI